jgi:hypothetical protein
MSYHRHCQLYLYPRLHPTIRVMVSQLLVMGSQLLVMDSQLLVMDSQLRDTVTRHIPRTRQVLIIKERLGGLIKINGILTELGMEHQGRPEIQMEMEMEENKAPDTIGDDNCEL